MTHTTLYRKYRPQTFEDVMGQEHITRVLDTSITKNEFGHAFLFSGSRGIGKTTVARIFAARIGTHQHDLYEIDAASNRGIDDIRELREAVNVLPYSSPYKVYIIDEVHMLTKEAFNALLKTLEEPPEHAIFILATTEPEKLPDTIVSRCMTFQFTRPTLDMLRGYVEYLSLQEGYSVEPSAAELIALLGNGSFRDSAGILQKVLSSITGKKKKISRALVEDITAAPKHELVIRILTALSEQDIEEGLAAVREAEKDGADMTLFLRLIISSVRAVLLLRFGGEFFQKDLAESFSKEDLERLSELAKKSDSISSATLKTLLDAERLMAVASLKALPLELAVVDMMTEQETAT